MITSVLIGALVTGGVYFNSLDTPDTLTSGNLFVNAYLHMSKLGAFAIAGWFLLVWVVAFLFISLFASMIHHAHTTDDEA